MKKWGTGTASNTLTIILILCLVLLAWLSGQTYKRVITLPDRVNGLYGQIEGIALKVEKPCEIEEIDKLVRENERLEQEVADLKNQIETYGAFWKGDGK